MTKLANTRSILKWVAKTSCQVENSTPLTTILNATLTNYPDSDANCPTKIRPRDEAETYIMIGGIEKRFSKNSHFGSRHFKLGGRPVSEASVPYTEQFFDIRPDSFDLCLA